MNVLCVSADGGHAGMGMWQSEGDEDTRLVGLCAEEIEARWMNDTRQNTVASDYSSSFNHVQPVPQNGNMSVLPGYVRFDDGNRVKINLNSRSKSDITHLKRNLVNELDQVRSLRKKLDSKEKFQSSFNDNFNNKITGSSGGDRIGTLDRANSEVSYVGQANSRPLYGNEKKKNLVNSKKS
ncbi:hypothetical protein DKX38_017602 [Salix brachista]|uniref:Uncharacterized protein n=1 Tax=Salix brachista TaxID=2182728 RepID=A0A5N5KX21_9ROSI|nr:hypothetical protein DKX38_017602 [Salix brachista]